MIIYLITNTVNGKQYVGKTQISTAHSWWQHCYEARIGSHCAVHRAIRKYGRASFTIEDIDIAESTADLASKERAWIAKLSSRTPRGYNLTDGGEGVAGFKMSEESRQRMIERLRGFKHSEESCRHMGESHRGKKRRPETMAKIAAANTGKKRSGEALKNIQEAGKRRLGVPQPAAVVEKRRLSLTGRPCREETKKKIADAQRGRVNGPLPEETKAKISVALKGKDNGHRRGTTHNRGISQKALDGAHAFNKGRKKSPEFCAKMRALHANESTQTRARKSVSAKIAWAKRRAKSEAVGR